MSERCQAQTVDGEPCQAWPMDDSDRCVAHQTTPADPDQTAGDGDRCEAPTRRGGLCKKVPLEGADRCHLHVDGLEPTDAEQQARREANMTHGYFVTGFLSDKEREIFQRVLEANGDLGELKQSIIAALTVRANRMMEWEFDGQDVSGFTTEVFETMIKALEAIEPEEHEVQYSWDIQEVRQQLEQLLQDDPTLVVKLVPPEDYDQVREAMAKREG